MRSFKEEKLFKKADIFVYLALIILLAAIFLAVFLPKKDTELTAAEIYHGDELVYEYDFLRKTGSVTAKGVTVVVSEQNVTLVTILTDKGRNVIEIGADYIKMAEADCSQHPDCVEKFSPLTAGNGAIVCLPHEIKIVTKGEISNEVTL